MLKSRDVFSYLFGDDIDYGITFYSSLPIADVLELEQDDSLVSESSCSILDILGEASSSPIVWISESEFVHVAPEKLGQRKLAAIPFFSSGYRDVDLGNVLQIIKGSNYNQQLAIENCLRERLEDADHLEFICQQTKSLCVLKHRNIVNWFSINGPILPGGQCVLPTGELSMLTNSSGEFSKESVFDMDGELVLWGVPIIHRGSGDVTRDFVERQYTLLESLETSAAKLIVEQGAITRLEQVRGHDTKGVDALEQVLSLSESYRKIHEIGIGTNSACSPLMRGNHFQNERYQGVHFGLGLGHFTPTHIDIVCPHIDINFIQ